MIDKLDRLLEKIVDSAGVLGIGIVVSLMLFLLCKLAFAFPSEHVTTKYPTKFLVECVLGEARGEGYDGMLAIAEGIRNRGSIQRVNGCYADFEYDRDIYITAALAWETSKFSNTVEGADEWRSTDIFGELNFDGTAMVFIKQIGAHRFYRRIKSER